MREWEGQKYPATQWSAIIDVDNHERLVKLFVDPSRRRYTVRRKPHLLAGIAVSQSAGSACLTGVSANGSGPAQIRTRVSKDQALGAAV